MNKVDELKQFETWTNDIFLGIGADKNTASLAHVGKMVRMIYDKGGIEGAEKLKAEIREHSEHYAGIPSIGSPYYTVFDAVLAPKEKP